MCICPQDIDSAMFSTASVSIPESIASNSTAITSTIGIEIMAHITSTVGPHFARQVMKFNNYTVVDKVPPDMLDRVGSHWY